MRPTSLELAHALSLPLGSSLSPADPETSPATRLLVALFPASAARNLAELVFDEGLDSLEALANADPRDLVDRLAPSGGTTVLKAAALAVKVARWISDEGGLDRLRSRADDDLRDNLRAIRGVGPSAAEQLLADVFHRSGVPIDRGTYRILARHGWLDTDAGYDEAQATIRDLAADTNTHALTQALTQIARKHCRASKPLCDACPLAPWLPDRGPIELGSD